MPVDLPKAGIFAPIFLSWHVYHGMIKRLYMAIRNGLPHVPLGLSSERVMITVVFIRQKGWPDQSGQPFVHVRHVCRIILYCELKRNITVWQTFTEPVT